jgi:integrase
MARRKKGAPVELADSHELSAGLIDALACPPGKTQAFLRDRKTPGLRVRVTAGGAKSYVFEAKLNRQTIRRTIGDVRSWAIDAAREEANRLRVLLDGGTDPRELERQQQSAKAAEQAEAAGRAVTVADAWPRYMAEGKPRKRDAWKPRYVADLHKAAAPGGKPRKRGAGKTKPGHLAPLMPMRLADIDGDAIRAWYAEEKKRAPIQAARAVAMFSGFLGWCATRKEYRKLVDKTCARASELGDVLPANKPRTDALEIDQLPAWFAGTDKLRNRAAAAYLQGLLLTGARREELAALRWDDVDFRWHKLTIADKVEATRVIPLTPYMASLLAGLQRLPGNPYVFASPTAASGRITEPRAPHAEVLADAGIPHVSIHGLRRSFALLGEASGAPAGAIAQVMGHKPSAIAERYKPRPIDALRGYLAHVEAFILDRAGIAFDAAKAAKGGLRVVAG